MSIFLHPAGTNFVKDHITTGTGQGAVIDREKGLNLTAHAIKEHATAPFVKLTEHIVKKQDRILFLAVKMNSSSESLSARAAVRC